MGSGVAALAAAHLGPVAGQARPRSRAARTAAERSGWFRPAFCSSRRNSGSDPTRAAASVRQGHMASSWPPSKRPARSSSSASRARSSQSSNRRRARQPLPASPARAARYPLARAAASGAGPAGQAGQKEPATQLSSVADSRGSPAARPRASRPSSKLRLHSDRATLSSQGASRRRSDAGSRPSRDKISLSSSPHSRSQAYCIQRRDSGVLPVCWAWDACCSARRTSSVFSMGKSRPFL